MSVVELYLIVKKRLYDDRIKRLRLTLIVFLVFKLKLSLSAAYERFKTNEYMCLIAEGGD